MLSYTFRGKVIIKYIFQIEQTVTKISQPCVKQGCRTVRGRGSELTFFGLRTACDRRPSVNSFV